MRYAFAVLLLAALSAPAAAQLTCCSRVTAIDARTGLVSATSSPAGSAFTFEVKDRLQLARLRVNQQVYADFAARTVGLDARTVCCQMVGTPAVASPAAARTPPTPSPATSPPAVAPPTTRSTNTASLIRSSPISMALPTIAYGMPYTRPAAQQGNALRLEPRTFTANVAGRTVNGAALHVRGIKAIAQATMIPDGARRLLMMHARTIPKGQSDHYVINPQLAAEWVAAHAVPDYVKVDQPSNPDCENFYDSFDCAGEALSDKWEHFWNQAVEAWNDATKKLLVDWNAPLACFTEQRLSLPDIPVKFAKTPAMTVNLSQSGSRGSATGSVSGSVTLGVPMQSDITAQLDLFYIPCLPFAVRPRSLAGDGALSVGEEINTTVTATGSFDKTFTIPPSGGPVIPIQVFPIVIGGYPVAEVDVSAYIEGNIRVTANGKVSGGFEIKNMHPMTFNFSCGGNGCSARSRGHRAPVTTSQSAQLNGHVKVKPALYTALQLNFNYQMLSARAGPQPFLEGVATGCVAATTAQNGAGGNTSQSNFALTADLDWGTELRAEALMMRNPVAEPLVVPVMEQKHLWFKDIAPTPSSALAAVVTVDSATGMGPRTVRVRMPTCYPYPEKVNLSVTWTGSPMLGSSSPACQSTGNGATCRLDPKQELVLVLQWPAAGSHTVTVTPRNDTHGRSFSPPQPTQVTLPITP
jgi:hypothetical protein